MAPAYVPGTYVPGAYVPGLQLAREFYVAVVRPLLSGYFPQVPYAAALLGPGSEVLGFDSQRSVDHDWGPRLQVFLTDEEAGQAEAVTAMLASRLPSSFRGYRVAFPVTPEPGGAARHRVQVTGLGPWLTGQIGFDPRGEITPLDWLATPTQRLAEFTAGEVFHDEPGDLTRARARLAWYPRDVWRYVLACQWQRIGQEEAFPGRCAEAGDDLGSVIVTARLARDLMRLALLMHRRYPPYSKWLGTTFARLPGAAGLGASLAAGVSGADWPVREQQMSQAYETVAGWHNELGVTAPLEARVRRFYDRPYQVIEAGRFTAALREAIDDPQIRDLPPTGAVDQFIDSTDAFGRLPFLRRAFALFSGGLPAGPAAAQQMAGDESDDDDPGRDHRVKGVAGDVAVDRADVAAGQVAQADPGPHPQRGAERVEGQETPPVQAGEAGHDPVHLAQSLDEPGHRDDPGAVPVEKARGPVQPRLGQAHVTAPPQGQWPTAEVPDGEADVVADHGRGEADDADHHHVEPAGARIDRGGDQYRLAGHGYPEVLDQDEQQDSPVPEVIERSGQGVEEAGQRRRRAHHAYGKRDAAQTANGVRLRIWT